VLEHQVGDVEGYGVFMHGSIFHGEMGKSITRLTNHPGMRLGYRPVGIHGRHWFGRRCELCPSYQAIAGGRCVMFVDVGGLHPGVNLVVFHGWSVVAFHGDGIFGHAGIHTGAAKNAFKTVQGENPWNAFAVDLNGAGGAFAGTEGAKGAILDMHLDTSAGLGDIGTYLERI
jgi:hypothetical protein